MTGPKMNGYHVHMSEISKGQGLQCAAGAPSWHALSKEEKDRCAAKAAEVRLQAETDPASLKKTLIHLLQKLGHLGIDSGVMLVEKKTRCCEVLGYGVVKTIFLNSDDVIDRIKNQYGSSRDGTATVAELQEHVRSKMNGVASRCTLKFKGFPWKAVQAGKIRISGWPAGLKKYVVSSMSRSDLKRLLDAEIVIHGLATTQVEQAPLTVPASTTGPTTVDEQAPPAALDNTTG
ncbi:uncharacterized protein [Littorina saxatilis]|uniref:uncharacterized protein n=1 Tax=Littorina saxatilis TaxID=31220 RepID=UPI0038B65B26